MEVEEEREWLRWRLLAGTGAGMVVARNSRLVWRGKLFRQGTTKHYGLITGQVCRFDHPFDGDCDNRLSLIRFVNVCLDCLPHLPTFHNLAAL
jgi:hypothetical protein